MKDFNIRLNKRILIKIISYTIRILINLLILRI